VTGSRNIGVNGSNGNEANQTVFNRVSLVTGSRNIGVNGSNGNEANQTVFNRVSLSANKEPVTSTTEQINAYEAERGRNLIRNAAFLKDIGIPTEEDKATAKEAERQAKLLKKQSKPVLPKVSIAPRESIRNRTQTSEENSSSSQKVPNDEDVRYEPTAMTTTNDDDDDDDDDDDADNNG